MIAKTSLTVYLLKTFNLLLPVNPFQFLKNNIGVTDQNDNQTLTFD